MRVYYFGVYTSAGGLENFAKNLISQVKSVDNKINFTILSTSKHISFEKEFIDMGCEIKLLPNPHANPIRFYRFFRKIIKTATSEDVLQLNICSYRNPLLFLACIGLKIKKVIVGHYTKVDDGRLPFLHYVNKFLFSKLGLKVSNSEDVTKFMFTEKSNVYFINNGVDQNRFAFCSHSRTMIREKLGISDDTILIGQIGRISPEKNQCFSMKVFEQLCEFNENFKMMFIGKEVDENLRKKINKSKFKNNIILYGPVYSHIEDFYSAFDLCLLPSKNEGMSLSLLECASNGVNALFSEAVPKLEIALPNLHYLPLDTKIWVDKIMSLIPNSLNANDRKSYLKNTIYDLNNTAKSYIDCYTNYYVIKRCIK